MSSLRKKVVDELLADLAKAKLLFSGKNAAVQGKVLCLITTNLTKTLFF